MPSADGAKPSPRGLPPRDRAAAPAPPSSSAPSLIALLAPEGLWGRHRDVARAERTGGLAPLGGGSRPSLLLPAPAGVRSPALFLQPPWSRVPDPKAQSGRGGASPRSPLSLQPASDAPPSSRCPPKHHYIWGLLFLRDCSRYCILEKGWRWGSHTKYLSRHCSTQMYKSPHLSTSWADLRNGWDGPSHYLAFLPKANFICGWHYALKIALWPLLT